MNTAIAMKPYMTLSKPFSMLSAPRPGPIVRSSMISIGAASEPARSSSAVSFASTVVMRPEICTRPPPISERITGAALCVGIARYALDRAARYARERTVWDTPIGAHQGVAHALAKAKIETELAALMTHRAAALHDRGLPAGEASNMAKYAAAEAAIAAVDAAMADLLSREGELLDDMSTDERAALTRALKRLLAPFEA